ncbi:MAG: site-2 protease family protein [Candidatus Aenigmatarchaeota archaeon]
MIDGYLISVVLFFAIIGILIYRDRKNIEFKYVLVMRRTKKFRNFIDRTAQLSPRTWKAIYTLAVVVCLIFMIVGVHLLLSTAYLISVGLITQPGLQLILPTPSATGAIGPGYILIPFWFWMIVIALILIPHEFSHGVIARAEKIRLKSVGLLLLAIFPGAFVEPDERQLKKARLMKRLRIFAAGSFANFAIALVVLLATMFLIWPAFTGPGVYLVGVNETGPAYAAGLQPNTTITEINGKPVHVTYWEHLGGRGYFVDEVGELDVDDVLVVKASGNTYEIRPEYDEVTNSTYIGIMYKPVFKADEKLFLLTLIPLLNMIWIFSLAVGIVNILPLYPLDGGLMFEAIVEKYYRKRAKQIVRAVTLLMLFILIFDFVGPSLLNI